MCGRSIAISLLTGCVLFLVPSMALHSASPGVRPAVSENVIVEEYVFETYRRHPRMEEEDRLRGRRFKWAPGLEIVANIDDAEVRFFGESVGRTPWESDNLAPGAYDVALKRTGYADLEFRVVVKSGTRTVVTAVLTEPMGRLVLSDLPPGAEVTVDRRKVEGTSLSVTAGQRLLEVRAFGWESASAAVTIEEGETTEWSYSGTGKAFAVETDGPRPKILPPDDPEGFLIPWTATAPGAATLSVFDPAGNLAAVIPVAVEAPSGTVRWPVSTGPAGPTEQVHPDGIYRVVIEGTGEDGVAAATETSLRIDSRYERRARMGNARVPGLAYAPGTAVLPPGVLQLSTGAGMHIGTGASAEAEGVPAHVSFRAAPAEGWEIGGRLGLTVRDPRENTSVDLSVAGGWRIPVPAGPFSAKITLLFSYSGSPSDFVRRPRASDGPWLPGPSLALPMELSLGNAALVLSPAGHLFFIGDNPAEHRFAGPARFAGSVGAGAYYQGRNFLVGGSAALRTPEIGGDMLDWTLWTAAEGRYDFPGQASFLAGSVGVRAMDDDPIVEIAMEFGIIL